MSYETRLWGCCFEYTTYKIRAMLYIPNFGIRKSQSIAIASLLAPALICAASPSVSHAGSYSFGPLITIVDVKNSQARGTLTVSNSGAEPIRVRIYVEDFTYSKDKGFSIVPTHPYSAVKYLQFSPRELVIPPNVTRNVRVNILLPSNLSDGEYRAVVFSEELKDDPKPQPGVATAVFKTRIGSVFFVNKGSGKPDIAISTLDWNPEKNRPQIILKNKGAVTDYPALQWKIEQNGKEIDNGEVLGVIVQNSSERAVALESKKNVKLAPGEYTISGQVIPRGKTPIPYSYTIKIP
jgi:P pilus assembly chaperone PapD